VSGYAKRMMEAAAPWMGVNPEPFAGRICLPRKFGERRFTPEQDAELRASVARFAKFGPEKQTKAATLIDGLIDSSHRLADWADEYEKAINEASVPCGASASTLESEELLAYAMGSWFLTWGHDGYNVFDLSPDFVAAMLLTDPKALDLDEFKLPFRGLLVFLPDGFARDAGGGSFTKVHVCEVRNEAGNVIDITASNGRRIISTSAHADAVTLRGLSAFGHEEEWGVSDEHDRGALRTLQHVIIGLAAYTASVAGAAVRREGGRSPRGPAKSAPVYWDVARTVRIDPHLVRAARAGSREVALRIKHRHIVRGHYRNQPIGEGRKERKTIWIAPFWKGPADGAAIVHTYKPSAPEPDADEVAR
jgi:hypothetical protein